MIIDIMVLDTIIDVFLRVLLCVKASPGNPFSKSVCYGVA